MTRRPGRRPGYKPHGEEIYRLRVRVHGLKRAELAARVGFSYDSIKSAELGNNISELLASRIAKALGVEVEDIASPPGDDAGSDPEPKALASLDAKIRPGRCERPGQKRETPLHTVTEQKGNATMTHPRFRRRTRPRFNGSPDDHAPTEQWPAQLRADDVDGGTYNWAGANDIGVMAIATFAPAGPAPPGGYQPAPAAFPALPPPAPEPERRPVLADVPVTEPAKIGDSLRLPVIWCEMPRCINWHLDPESAGEHDARDRAHAAGWRTDALGRLTCPPCQQTRADYRTPQPLTWQHREVPRRWHERGTLPTEETQDRLAAEAEYARIVSYKNPALARAMIGATSRHRAVTS